MTKRLPLLSSLLVLTTSLVALPALAQDAGAPTFKLDGTLGVTGFNLPSYDNGLGHVAGGNLLGGMIGGKLSANLGEANGWSTVLGISAFGAFGIGGSTEWSDSLTGSGTVTGLDPNVGGISLSTPGADAASTVTGPGGFASTTTVGGPANVAAVTPDGTGFELSAVTSDGANGNAYGGIGSSQGGGFVYDGPVDRYSSVSRSVFYGGADLTIGLNGTFDSATNVEVFAGPSLRALLQKNTSSATFDIPEVSGAATPITIPTYTLAVSDNLMSTYLGGVLGGNVSFEGTPGVTFTLGATGGAYFVHSSWEAHDTYSTCCGVTGAPQNAPSPAISVDGPSHKTDLADKVAFSAQGSGAATFAVSGNRSVTIGGNVGYLSYVPTVGRPGGVLTFGDGSMITYGASATFSGHF